MGKRIIKIEMAGKHVYKLLPVNDIMIITCETQHMRAFIRPGDVNLKFYK